jgi:xanthine dehydrogenase accessory factor
MITIFRALAELEEKGEGGILCTIVSSQGSTPRHTGSKLLLYPDGHFIGTIGGGEIESRVIQEAKQAFQDEKPRFLSYKMVNPQEGDPGVCGGTVEVYIEPILPSPSLLIIGGGHVGKAVAHLAHWLGFRVIVSDDRPEYCTPEQIPDADIFLPMPMTDIPHQMEITPNTYIILTTRGMAIDVKGMPAIMNTPAAYIGVIGSKRRWLATQKELLNLGIAEVSFNRVHSPMGLELNAETPEEIAVSIMAEIVMLMRGGSGKSMKA